MNKIMKFTIFHRLCVQIVTDLDYQAGKIDVIRPMSVVGSC